jgi:hypothetical protein
VISTGPHLLDALNGHMLIGQGTVGPRSLAAARLPPLAVPGSTQLPYQASLIKLSDGREQLTDKHAGRLAIGDGQVLAALALNDLDTPFPKLLQENFANHQISCDAVGSLDPAPSGLHSRPDGPARPSAGRGHPNP